MTTTYTRAEVAKHASADDNWIIIDDTVYDVSKFARFHPGGRAFVDGVAGQDATKQFYSFHRQDVLRSMAAKYAIGKIADPPTGKKAVVKLAPGELSTVPYAEPSAFQGVPSPYYDESHRRFRRDLRAFFDTEVMPDAVANDARGVHPSKELWRKLGMRGVLACRIQSGPWLKDIVDNCGVTLPGGITPAQFDPFHELIAHEESSGRLGVPGYADGMGAGLVIGLPPVLQFGEPALARKVGREVLTGEKQICLAISGPEAGSDVANVACVAKLSSCKTHYLVSGVKKWITNGVFSDYFVTAVVTKPGPKPELSLMLIERGEGVDTKPIKTSYSPAAGTAYVTFENARVPTGNVLGKIGEGFKLIMHNFNHERWYIVAGANRASRLVVEECLKWSTQREVFQSSAHRSAGDSEQAGEAGEPGGGRAGVAGGGDVRHEAHDARGAGGQARRAHRAAEALLHASRQRRQRRGVPDLRRPRHHADGDGAGGGEVSEERQVRGHSGGIGGGHGGPGSAAGDAGHAQRQAVSRC